MNRPIFTVPPDAFWCILCALTTFIITVVLVVAVIKALPEGW